MIISMCDYSKLIVVTNRQLCQGDFLQQIKKVVALKPAGLILREKDLDGAEYSVLAKAVLEICQGANVPMFLHSHLRLAEALECQGVHLPYAYFMENLKQVHKLQEEKKLLVSVSCHSKEEALAAVSNGADQIVLGTIFATDCKPGKIGAGLEFLKEVCEACPVPVYAIGGINSDRLQDVLQAGAAGGCMMSGFMRRIFGLQ